MNPNCRVVGFPERELFRFKEGGYGEVIKVYSQRKGRGGGEMVEKRSGGRLKSRAKLH